MSLKLLNAIGNMIDSPKKHESKSVAPGRHPTMKDEGDPSAVEAGQSEPHGEKFGLNEMGGHLCGDCHANLVRVASMRNKHGLSSKHSEPKMDSDGDFDGDK